MPYIDINNQWDRDPEVEPQDAPLRCPDCGEITNDGERCGECLSLALEGCA